MHLLSLLIFTPVVVALVMMMIPAKFSGAFRVLAVAASVVQSVFLTVILQAYSPLAGLQHVEKMSWISFNLESIGQFKAEYFVGVDGLSMTLLLLSVIVLFIATIASWNVEKNRKGYFILLLVLNSAIIGSFCALDMLLFYVFFEFMLLPMYFLIGIWGGPKREYASIKFFLYTLLGSILILIVMIGLYISVQDPNGGGPVIHTFNMISMSDPANLIPGSVLHPGTAVTLGGYSLRTWAFLLLLIGFGIKLPMVPFHTWLPDAHVEAPTAISVILAALLLKIGAYGLLRIAYPVFPQEAVAAAWWVALLGLVSIIYGALNALASKDIKRLIAFSSVSHMGFVLLGLASATPEGAAGAVYQLFSHGLLASMLFLLAGVLSDRTNDRTIENYSGLSSVMKSYTAFIIVAFFASMGLPGFSGFVAEIMVFLGAFESSVTNTLVPRWMAMVSTSGLLLAAAYYIWTLQRMFFGKFFIKIAAPVPEDLGAREYLMLLPLALLVVLFGVYPQPLLDIINPFAADLVALIMNSKP